MKISVWTLVTFLLANGKISLAKGATDNVPSRNGNERRRYLHGASLVETVDKTQGFQNVVVKASKLFQDQKKNNANDEERRFLSDKSSKKGKGGKKQATTKVEECQAKLQQCQAELNAPSWLFVQMANHCILTRSKSMSSSGEEVVAYALSSRDMAEETWGFTDRPFQVEGTQPTKDFFDRFDATFGVDSTEGSPNAAFTFVHEEDHVFNGPLVAVMIDASYATTDETTGEVTYTYALTQSEEQGATLGLDSFFEDGDVDNVVFEDCSIFVDSSLMDISRLTCQCETGNKNFNDAPSAKYHCWFDDQPSKNIDGTDRLAISRDDNPTFAGDFYCVKGPDKDNLEYSNCNFEGYITIHQDEVRVNPNPTEPSLYPTGNPLWDDVGCALGLNIPGGAFVEVLCENVDQKMCSKKDNL